MLDSKEGFESPQDKEEKRKVFLCRYGKNSVLILMPLSLWKEFSIDLNARDVKRKSNLEFNLRVVYFHIFQLILSILTTAE